MSKEQEIGNLFKESLQGYQAEPPAGTWDAIAHDKTLLKFNRRKRLWRGVKFSAFPLAGLIAVIIISTVLFPKAPKDDSRAATTETAVTTPAVTTDVPSSPTPSVPVVANGNRVSDMPAPRQNTDIVASQPTENKEDEPVAEPSAVAETPVATEQPTASAKPNWDRPKPVAETLDIRRSPRSSENDNDLIDPQPKSGKSGQLLWSRDTTVCRNSKLTLFVQNAVDVHWNIGWQGESVTIYPEEPLVVAATITTGDKTDTTVYIHIGVVDCGLWIPTAFTPNSDGLNDEFLVHAPADINRYECTIYDRSRGILFRTQNIRQGWDGTFNGKPLPFGSYFYIITYYDALGIKHVEKGQITLIR